MRKSSELKFNPIRFIRADYNFILWSLIPYIAAWSGEKLMGEDIFYFRIISERTQKDLSERSKSMDDGESSYRRFLDGDDNGFVEIVRDYKDGLILFLNSFVNNIDVAEELTEETFVKLGIKKPKYKPKASFRTWLYAIGRNVAIDYIRKNRKYNEISIDDYAEALSDEISLEKSYIRQEQKISLHKAMRKLKPEYTTQHWAKVPSQELSDAFVEAFKDKLK